MRTQHLLAKLHRLPGLGAALEWRYERLFEKADNLQLFRGVYPSYAQALASAPKTKPTSYDQPEPAALYRDRLDSIVHTDYPILYWLGRLSGQYQSVFDIGGHIGVKYYAFRKYLDYPHELRWRVCDVPAVTQAGEEVASERGAQGLSFTNDFADMNGTDLLLAMGSLQYLEHSLGELLRPVANKPRHILINTTPIGESPTFYTLNSIGVAFCPYRVANKQEFVSELTALGYTCIDEWQNHGKNTIVPFAPERSVEHYTGFYFRLQS